MTFHYLHLRDWAIFDQLKLEEGLLRADDRNFFLISEGSRLPSIVMGISGKLEQLVDRDRLSSLDIPLIRRFSGGGTVVVDEETLFVTFIGDKSLLENASPETVLKWAESIFQRALGHPEFHLRENDFAIGEKKCGGNALYLQKNRWLLHTSFLWSYKKERMDLLLHPPKTPTYRLGRSHEDFICRMEEHFPSKQEISSRIVAEMQKRFGLQEANIEEIETVLAGSSHRRSTRVENPSLGASLLPH